MLFSIEKLHHFQCFHCKRWFSIGDFQKVKVKSLFCPFCGQRSNLTFHNKNCTKQKFSKLEANAILLKCFYQNMVLKKANRQERNSYFCEVCQAYHLTSGEPDEIQTTKEKRRKKS